MNRLYSGQRSAKRQNSKCVAAAAAGLFFCFVILIIAIVFRVRFSLFSFLTLGFSCSFFPKCNIVLLRRLLLSSPLALSLMLAQMCSSLGGDVIE